VRTSLPLVFVSHLPVILNAPVKDPYRWCSPVCRAQSRPWILVPGVGETPLVRAEACQELLCETAEGMEVSANHLWL
jgi:hypothetical protein